MAKIGANQRKDKYNSITSEVLNTVPSLSKPGIKRLGDLEMASARVLGIYGLLLCYASKDGISNMPNEWLQELAQRVKQAGLKLDADAKARKYDTTTRSENHKREVWQALEIAAQSLRFPTDEQAKTLGLMLCCAATFTREVSSDLSMNTDDLNEHLNDAFNYGTRLWREAESGELAGDIKESCRLLNLSMEVDDFGHHAVLLCGRLDERIARTLNAWNQQRVSKSTYPWSLYVLPTLLRELSLESDKIVRAYNDRFFGTAKLTKHQMRMVAALYLKHEHNRTWDDIGSVDAKEDDPFLAWYYRVCRWDNESRKRRATIGNEAARYVDQIKNYVSAHPHSPTEWQVSGALEHLQALPYPGLDGTGKP